MYSATAVARNVQVQTARTLKGERGADGACGYRVPLFVINSADTHVSAAKPGVVYAFCGGTDIDIVVTYQVDYQIVHVQYRICRCL